MLTDGLGSQWVLWVNVPIGLIAAAVAPTLIAESRSEGAGRHFDFAGAASITAGLSLLVYALVDANGAGWGSARTISLLTIAVALISAFVVIELRSRSPLVPFRIFRLGTLRGANVVGLMVGASLFSMSFFISLYMQQVLATARSRAGLSYLPLAVSIIILAGIASQLVTRIGFKPVLATGLGLIATGLIWFSQIAVHGGFVSDILEPSLRAAVGLGFAFVPVTIAVGRAFADLGLSPEGDVASRLPEIGQRLEDQAATPGLARRTAPAVRLKSCCACICLVRSRSSWTVP